MSKGLTAVNSLKKRLPFLTDTPDDLLALISPAMLALFVFLLPFLLYAFAALEGLISEASLNASVFGKLTLFNALQTFFVSAISGSLFHSLRQVVSDHVHQSGP